jgi:hypothetical protein
MVSLRSAQFSFYGELQISTIFESQSVFLENSIYMFALHVLGETKRFLKHQFREKNGIFLIRSSNMLLFHLIVASFKTINLLSKK